MSNSGLPVIDPAELAACVPADPDAGLGSIRTSSGNLPLRRLGVRARIVGLSSRVVLTQRFHNPHPEPLEATYIFPLPDRGAVTALRMAAGDRTIVARLKEREQARREYDAAVASGRRASIAEEERPDVFTLRVGNILPGEQVTVELTVVGVLPVADGAATFRFPLVVAPRYIPGSASAGDAVGGGWQPDTDVVPDASRITPPVLLPGFPDPVELDVEVELDPAGLEMGRPRSSLHAVQVDGGRIRFEPGARPDRDVVLRIPLGRADGPSASLALVPDDGGTEGTFELTVLPPGLAAVTRPRDVVLLLDRSGSMGGWKMVAARRAAARIIDTLTDHDRFAVIAFDDQVDTPGTLPSGLVPATDRNRFRAVEFLAALRARGGTELSAPLGRGLRLLAGTDTPARDHVLVLVTDGQVGNEDHLLRTHAKEIGSVRLHTVGIDKAVNAGFLGRLASLGGGRCELVESEDHLDEAMTNIHRRIGSPLVAGVSLEFEGLAVDRGSITPARLPDVFPGVPHVVRGRFASAGDAVVTLTGQAPDGTPFRVAARGRVTAEPAIAAAWARAHLRDLEDRYVCAGPAELEQKILSISLRFGVLCRFTAFVAVDDRVVTDGSAPRSIVQPVELPSGWGDADGLAGALPMAAMSFSSASVSAPLPAMPAAAAPLARPRVAGVAKAVFARAGGMPSRSETHDDDAVLRRLLATEAARLRDLKDQPEHRRREALLDLGSRLAALAGDSSDLRWRTLLDLLRPENLSAAPFAETWAKVLELLDGLTGGGPQTRGRPSFWKRPSGD